MNGCADPVIIVSPDQKITYLNKRAIEIFGTPSLLTEIISETDALSIARTPFFSVKELSVIKSDGKTIRQSAAVVDISPQDPSQQFILIVFKSSSSSHFSLNSREELLSSVAHDLKNPLGAIFGFVDAIIDTESASNLSTRQLEVLNRIRATTMRSIDMVKNFQLLSALHSGNIRRANIPCNLNVVVKGVLEATWREGVGAPRLTTSLCTSDLLIQCERIMLDRIVSNLLSNALRYTPPQHTIEIATCKKANNAVLTVHNTGSYISSEDQNRIFDRYVRANSSGGSSGSGLGLYIIKRISELISGTVSVKSSKTKGTTFVVELPLAITTPVAPVTE